jgi:hypothetical protein
MGIAKLTEDFGPGGHLPHLLDLLEDWATETEVEDILPLVIASYLIDDCLLEPKLGKVTQETVKSQVKAVLRTWIAPRFKVEEHVFQNNVWGAILHRVRKSQGY